MVVPLFLTFSRLVIAPLLLPILLIQYFPLQDFFINKILSFLIFCFGLTDFFDGYLSRKWGQTTHLGRMLDPIADKVFVLSLFFTLYYLGQLPFAFVLGILIREVWVTIERFYRDIPVSLWGKSKSLLQYVLIVFVVGTPWFGNGFDSLIKGCLGFLVVLVTVISWNVYSEKPDLYYKKHKKI